MPRTLALAAVTALLSLGTGCNDVSIGGYDDGPQIDKRGISVPIPPPSLWDSPIQKVTIEGKLGFSNPELMTTVTLQNAFSPQWDQVYADADGSFRFVEVEIDLTQNCLEVWSEEPGPYGDMSLHSFFRASIDPDDPQQIVTEQFFSGC
jgi:hypothetical protein